MKDAAKKIHEEKKLMILTATFSPRNSLVLVMDSSIGEIPSSMGAGLVASTRSCLAIGTLSETDGETTITLTDSEDAVEHAGLAFDGFLSTPAQELSVCIVEDKALLTIPLDSSETRVRVFANDHDEPDRVYVLVETR